ncbi:DNA-binding GntR family transcriptional regulator [Clostridium sp. KNHs216]|nr:DNA-binding GntR family transcriptional regulator [Clostridium sp. KNHs216]
MKSHEKLKIFLIKKHIDFSCKRVYSIYSLVNGCDSVKTLKRNLDDIVYETICDGFVGGQYIAGKRLDPAELAERYQVSQTPVIQALKRLVHEHICEISQGGKYMIPVATEEEIQEVCIARLLFEEDAVVKLCDTITTEDLDFLALQEEKCEKLYRQGKSDEYFKADMALHKMLVKLAGNHYLYNLYRMLNNKYMIIRATTGTSLQHNEAAVREHKELLEALRKHSKKDARRLIRNHIVKMKKRINGQE